MFVVSPYYSWLEEHSTSRYHNSFVEIRTHEATVSSLICSDTVTLQLVIDSGTIKEAWHFAQGCLVAQASASFICHWSEDKQASDVVNMSESDYLNLLSPLTPLRQQCALLAFRCLQKAVTEGRIDTAKGGKESAAVRAM